VKKEKGGARQPSKVKSSVTLPAQFLTCNRGEVTHNYDGKKQEEGQKKGEEETGDDPTHLRKGLKNHVPTP